MSIATDQKVAELEARLNDLEERVLALETDPEDITSEDFDTLEHRLEQIEKRVKRG